MMNERLWTAKQLAEVSKLTQRRILQLLKAGEIRGQQLSAWQWIITDTEARRWLQSRGISVSDH